MDPFDTATILYTSGTTGKPKGAEGCHFAIVEQTSSLLTDAFDLTAEDRVLGCLPLFHTFGQVCVMNVGFRAGAAVVLVPRFDGATALELLNRHACTIMTGVPTMYMALLEAAKSNPERPPLKYGLSGGSALPLAVIERFREVYGVNIHEGYGLTETSPVATFNVVGKPTRAGTALGRRGGDRRRRGGRHHRAPAARGARRDRRARAQPHEGIPSPAGGDGRGRDRRLVPHG
jgi:long-chain acyl-CoA synthetase